MYLKFASNFARVNGTAVLRNFRRAIGCETGKILFIAESNKMCYAENKKFTSFLPFSDYSFRWKSPHFAVFYHITQKMCSRGIAG